MDLNIRVWETMQYTANITHNIQTARDQSMCLIPGINCNNSLRKVTTFRPFEGSQFVTSQVSQLTQSLWFGSYYAVWCRTLHETSWPTHKVSYTLLHLLEHSCTFYILYIQFYKASHTNIHIYIQLHLEPKLRVTEAIPLLPLCTFMVCAGIIYSLHTDHNSNVDICLWSRGKDRIPSEVWTSHCTKFKQLNFQTSVLLDIFSLHFKFWPTLPVSVTPVTGPNLIWKLSNGPEIQTAVWHYWLLLNYHITVAG